LSQLIEHASSFGHINTIVDILITTYHPRQHRQKQELSNVTDNVEALNDIQFVAGLIWRDSDIIITYGVGDCISAMVRVPVKTLSEFYEAIATLPMVRTC
jgi:hypothetical protein